MKAGFTKPAPMQLIEEADIRCPPSFYLCEGGHSDVRFHYFPIAFLILSTISAVVKFAFTK